MKLRYKDLRRVAGMLLKHPLRTVLDIVRIPREASLIRKSKFFDQEWYLNDNPWVRHSGADPVLHYLLYGYKEGMNPSPRFIGDEYCLLNPDVKALGVNPLLHYLKRGLRAHRRLYVREGYKGFSAERYSDSLEERRGRIRDKLRGGEKLNVVFFTSSIAMFCARSLYEAMVMDERFSVRIIVVPELRLGKDLRSAMEKCRQTLISDYPSGDIAMAQQGSSGDWLEMTRGADIVCYPSPYNLYPFWYNPCLAPEAEFLPIHVNYGFPISNTIRHLPKSQNYQYFWRFLGECDDTLADYVEDSPSHGANFINSGYVKMDRLASFKRRNHARKRVLITPHHSVDGGMNKELSLANFCRYADFFMQLPDRYPNLDFIFRPHPFLFRVLRRPDQWGDEKVETYLRTLRARKNVFWSEGGDYFQEFVDSDACINDCGSFLAEYFYTGRPMCYMLKRPKDKTEKFNTLGRHCIENSYIAYTQEEIDSFIKNVVLEENDPMRVAREEFMRRLMLNYPHASAVAIEQLIKEIDRT